MSVITPQQFGTGFIGAPASELDPAFAQSSLGATTLPPYADNIMTGSPITLPIELPPGSPALGSGSCPPGAYGSSGSNSNGFNTTFGSILNQIGNAIQNLFNQLSASLGNFGGTSTPSSSPGQTPETYFSSATAGSVGDPHLSFDGTNGAGDTVSGKWNSMTSHANLLSSGSFNGGYTESTVATAPNAKGVAYNQSATIATDGGQTAVTMQGNGSYSVTENGRNVALTQGSATALGNGESVTLTSNGSLTIEDRNQRGGSLETTLTSDGDGGVDVTNTASHVELGGYLVDKSDNDPSAVAYAATSGWNQTTPAAGYLVSALQNHIEQGPTWQQLQSTYENVTAAPRNDYGSGAGEPMIDGLQSYDPESPGTTLANIELA